MTENLEKDRAYSVEWIDGYGITKCIFVQSLRGFLIFIDSKGDRVVCRETSMKSIKKLDT